MSDFKVFYSWQSDLPNATNRTFIGDALEKACKEVERNPEVEESPRVDQDTKGLSGAPSIPQAIIEKINACQAFVADVSFCYRADDGTQSPNPNVAYELGYAVARLGWDRIILVLNSEYGSREDLPFDMEKRRAMSYAARKGEEDRSDSKKDLVKQLIGAIEAITKLQPIVTRVSPHEAAREALLAERQDRVLKVREFIQWVIDSVRAQHPGAVDADKWVESLVTTVPIAEAFSSVAEAAAVVDDPRGAKELWRGFERLLGEYDVPPGFSGGYTPADYEWWKFHGYELCVILCAHLLQEQKLALLRSLLDEPFVQRRWAESRVSGHADYRDVNDHLRYVEAWNANLKRSGLPGWISAEGELFKQRYEKTSGNLPSWEEFMESDLLLGLISGAQVEQGGYPQWLPHTQVYITSAPRFILRARGVAQAEELRHLFAAGGIPQLRESITATWGTFSKGWGGFFSGRFFPAQEINAIGNGS